MAIDFLTRDRVQAGKYNINNFIEMFNEVETQIMPITAFVGDSEGKGGIDEQLSRIFPLERSLGDISPQDRNKIGTEIDRIRLFLRAIRESILAINSQERNQLSEKAVKNSKRRTRHNLEVIRDSGLGINSLAYDLKKRFRREASESFEMILTYSVKLSEICRDLLEKYY